jgi:hypothetical protein
VEWTRIVAASTTPDARFAIARDLKETVKARFDGEAWQRVAQPIFDKLRQRQRDALVAYIMQQARFDRIEQLYEYFLIDPAMEPVVQTSRIRLAIASVQLFVQRCLLNLEKDVHPTAIINAEHWEWMKRYRVWEANRKIFGAGVPRRQDASLRRARRSAAAGRPFARSRRGRVPDLPPKARAARAAPDRGDAPRGQRGPRP